MDITRIKSRNGNKFKDATGWLLIITLLFCLAGLVDPNYINPEHKNFILLLGAIGMWRYSNAFIHYTRGMYFLHYKFPLMRKKVDSLTDEAMPSHIYLVVTSFRIPAHTTFKVYQSVFREGIRTGAPVTVVISIVEKADERLIKDLLIKEAGEHSDVRLIIVRARGTGKRDGLSHAFKAISRDMPARDAIVGVVDGDTVLLPDCVKNAVGFFKYLPSVGGVTTDEYCIVEGGTLVSEWHTMRFVQRHINMCSMALSKKVLTMTGRLSFFRAEIITDADFIAGIEEDHLNHWRLGKFKFLTGDDKSSWYNLVRMGWDTFYIPDSKTLTIEHPPDKRFFKSTRQLMYRWYGNSLRQNFRAVKMLGRKRLGLFATYVLLDQRVSMWTGLIGLTSSVILSVLVSIDYLFIYVFWILLSRTIITLTYITSGHGISPYYPFVLYYNQIIGSVMKIYTMFHLDQQSWTRQKTTLKNRSIPIDIIINKVTSKTMLISSWCYFLGADGLLISLVL